MAEEKVKEEKKETKGKTLGTICPACNASIKFNAKANKWKCDYCGSEFTLETCEIPFSKIEHDKMRVVNS